MSEFSKVSDVITQIPSREEIELFAKLSFRERRQIIIDIENEVKGNLNEIDGYNCELCKNRGHIWKLNDDDMDTRVDCKCKTVRATLARAKRSGLGDIITEYTFDKYEDTEDWQKHIKSKAKAFCQDDKAKWFCIGGQVGCGKTHICTAIAAHYIKAGYEVKYMLWSKEAKQLKQLANDIRYQELINPIKEAKVLYIDDFLKVQNGEAPTAGDINVAFEIINERLLSSDKITIISSEKTMDEIIDYDEALMSRMFHQAGDYKLNIEKNRDRNYRLRTS